MKYHRLLMIHPGPRHPDSHDIAVLLAPFLDELVDLYSVELPSGLSVSHPALSQPVVPSQRAGDAPISEEVKYRRFNKV